MITWSKAKGRYIIHKNGVFFSLENEHEVDELLAVLGDIKSGSANYFHADPRAPFTAQSHQPHTEDKRS